MPTYQFGFWNLENLFAPESFADREPRLAQKIGSDLAGWSEALFEKKLTQLSKVIASMADDAGPDILGVCEVENRFVLEELTKVLNDLLPGRSYDVVHADNKKDRRGIDTAYIFDSRQFSVDPDAVFSHFVIRRTGTRDISQATFKTDSGNELVALCNHWPARTRQGPHATAGFRATAGETLGYWHGRIREMRDDDIAIIAVGDFNDDPWDPSITFNANATREEGDVRRATSAKFHNLAWRYLTAEVTDHKGDQRVIDGTLYFNNNGNLFDQILVNRSLLTGEGDLKVDVESAGIHAFPKMVDHRVSQGPIRFGLPKGNAANVNEDGFSDHFPVIVTIEE